MEEENVPAVDWKGRGKALRVYRGTGVEVEDIGLKLGSRLVIVAEEEEWEDGGGGGEQDLYGNGM